MTLFPLLVALLACTGDQKPGTDDTSAEGEGEGEGEGAADCTDDSQCADGEICEPDTCVEGDRNNAADEAEAIVWETEAGGVLNPAGDTDFYAFVAEGGEFVRVQTILTADADTLEAEGWDSALILRNPAGQVVASVDNYPTGTRVSGYDSVLYAYLADAGTYTLQVEDLGDFDSSRDPLGDPDYAYSIEVKKIGNHTDETDSFDDPSYDLDITGDRTLYAVGAALETEDDIDYIDVAFPWSQAGIYIAGMANLGGSEANPLVQLYDADGQILTSKEGVGPDGYAVYPAMEDAHYVMALSDADGGGSDSWFYVFVLIEAEGDAYQAEEEPNDDTTGATRMTQYTTENNSGQDYTYGRAQGVLDPVGDADVWRIEGFDGGALILCLNATMYGSSAVPTVDVYDSDGALLESAEGDADASGSQGTTVIENLPLDADLYTLVVHDDAGVGGLDAWYRMLVYVTSFETTDYSCP